MVIIEVFLFWASHLWFDGIRNIALTCLWCLRSIFKAYVEQKFLESIRETSSRSQFQTRIPANSLMTQRVRWRRKKAVSEIKRDIIQFPGDVAWNGIIIAKELTKWVPRPLKRLPSQYILEVLLTRALWWQVRSVAQRWKCNNVEDTFEHLNWRNLRWRLLFVLRVHMCKLLGLLRRLRCSGEDLEVVYVQRANTRCVGRLIYITVYLTTMHRKWNTVCVYWTNCR